MAKRPIITGMKLTPLKRLTLLKVKRGNPVMLSIPMKERATPKQPQRIPFDSELPDRLEMIERPKMARRKNSGALNLRAIFASWGESSTRKTTLMVPPRKEEIVEDAEGAAALALLGHRVSVKDGRRRRGRSRRMEENRGDGAAVDGAHVDAEEEEHAGGRSHAEGKREHESDAHRRRQARQGPDADAGEDADADIEENLPIKNAGQYC
jgi:hypothetical protein